MLLRFFCLLVLMPLLSHAEDVNREQIQQRIAPVGRVRIQEPGFSLGATEKTPLVKGPVTVKKHPGQETYEQHCVICHQDGVAGAPRFRDTTDWESRLGLEDLDLMTATAMKGLNAMPAKGTCQECTEADIKAAIGYMVPK